MLRATDTTQKEHAVMPTTTTPGRRWRIRSEAIVIRIYHA